MLISYNWLQTYFKEKLPPADKIAETLIFHSFEIESVEKKRDDFIFDIKVLPDRAHDCLSHRGVARELAVHLNLKTAEEVKLSKTSAEKPKRRLSIEVKEPALCRRYTGLMLEGINIGSSPEWLKNRLESIGQKSINNVVDATNFVMFNLEQPLHAFDADKVKGGITVRNADKGEKITTLDGKEVALDKSVLVIADSESPLAIAGIKGGKKAEVTAGTKNIILEAANFLPVSVRKTSKRLGIQTDSSKRFENELSPEKTKEAIEAVANLILEIAGSKEVKIGDIVDSYPRQPASYIVGVSTTEINNVLGINLTKKDVSNILTRFGFQYNAIDNPLIDAASSAEKVVGRPYKRGASIVYDAPNSFDCSSLISWSFVQAGVAIPRVSIDQFVFADKIKKEELLRGDVVFTNTKQIIHTKGDYYSQVLRTVVSEQPIRTESLEYLPGTKVPHGIDHAGVYLGDNKIIHASSSHGVVVVEDLKTSQQFQNECWYGRMVQTNESRFSVVIPHERLDIRIKEDLIEEIGKAIGYDKVPALPLQKSDIPVGINKPFFYANKIRNILIQEGFSEIYTSSFAGEGKVPVENPIASDKGFLRSDLKENMLKSLELNAKNAPLLGIEDVKMFEIGKVFKKPTEEKMFLTIGVCGKKAKDLAEKTLDELGKRLGSETKRDIKQAGDKIVIEIDFNNLIEKLPEPKDYEDTLATKIDGAVYRKISSYPFIARDIALWVPEDVESETVLEILKEKSGELLARAGLFDVFKKDGKISYAYRLVFQSQDRTLTDDETNAIMNEIYAELGKRGWQVR